MRFVWVGMLGLLCLFAACSKGKPLTPADIDAPEALQRQQAKGEFPVHIELTRLVYELRPDGTYDRTWEQRYRVLTENGVNNWSYTQAYWSPWYMKRPELSVTVANKKADGSLASLRLDPATLTEQPAHPEAPDIYSDARVLRAPLPSVAIGSLVHEVIKTGTHRPFLSKQHAHSMAFQGPLPQDKVELVVEAPSDMEIFFEVRDAKVERSESKSNGRTRYVFRGGPYSGLEPPEALVPGSTPEWPSVAFSTGEDWRPLAQDYSKIVDDKLSGIDFSTTVGKVVSKSDSDADKAAKLYRWIKSKVRYVGIEFGESGVVPHAPDQTVGQGYGDCKDQATLLVGLLRAAGLPAHVALLQVASREDVSAKLAGMNVFDHAIVVVPTATPMWFDPTADHVAAGALPVSDQRRLALVAAPDTSSLVFTPEPTPGTNRYREHREVFLSAHGPARVLERSHGTGQPDTELREAFDLSEDAVKENMEAYAQRTYYTKQHDKLSYTKPSELLTPFEVQFEALDSRVGYTGVLDASVELREEVVASWLPDALTDDENERKSTLVLPVPYQAELIWEIHPPPGQEPAKLPEKASMDLGPAHFERTVTRGDGNSVMVRTTFTTGKARYSPAEVKAFREAWWRYRQSPLAYLEYIHPAKKLQESGNPKAGVELIQKEIAAKKGEAIARMRLANLVLPYVKSSAYEQARQAAQLAPDNALLQQELASVLSDNGFGQDLGPGYDRQGALAAYRKAYELDKEDLGSRLRIAVVLEHDDDGKRYASDDLDEAIQIYDSIPERKLQEFEKGSFRHNALYALFWAKRYAELEGRLARLAREDLPARLAVMNAAALHGAEQAIREAERLALSGSELAAALEAASGTLATARNYPEAAKLIEAAIPSSEEAARLQSRARVLRRIKKLDAKSLPEGSPNELVTKIIAMAIGGLAEPEALARQFISKRAWYKNGESVLIGVLKAYGSAASDRKEPERETLGDFGGGGLELKVEGSDATGYRVSATLAYGEAKQFQVFVVKEASAYKVRAFGGLIGELGSEAYHLAKNGKREGAKQWLDWARETYRAGSGEDPLRVAPFARLYNEGKGDVELAAMALTATSKHAATVIEPLKKELSKAKDADQSEILEHALVLAYDNAEQYEKKLQMAKQLQQRRPKSKIARNLVMEALWELERYRDYGQVVDRALAEAEVRETPWLKGRLAAAAIAQRRFETARKINEELIESGKAEASTYNGQAWLGLFTGLEKSDLDYALKSLEMQRSAPALHTLGCVYADLGRVDEARRTLKDLLGYRKNGVMASIDWVIIGQMAQGLGLPRAAKEAYEKVEKPKHVWPTSTYALAQIRRQKLGK